MYLQSRMGDRMKPFIPPFQHFTNLSTWWTKVRSVETTLSDLFKWRLFKHVLERAALWRNNDKSFLSIVNKLVYELCKIASVYHIQNNVCTPVAKCLWAHDMVILVLNFAATRETNTKITLKLVYKQCVTRVHTLFNFLHDIANPQMMIKTTIYILFTRVSLARLTFCWWRHNRLLMTPQWSNNWDAITWIMIFNSLGIDFIHGDIHDRSCKKFVHITAFRLNPWLTAVERNILIHVLSNSW